MPDSRGTGATILALSHGILAAAPLVSEYGWGRTALAGGMVTLLARAWLHRIPPRTRLPWFSLVIPASAGLDYLVGTPSAPRTLLYLGLSLCALAVGSVAERWAPARDSKKWSRAFFLFLALVAFVAFGALTYKAAIFGDRELGQDTAYFEQSIWGFVTGRSFFLGTSQAWWRYSPPLQSHFGMHFSPVLFLLAALYRLWPSYHLLHLVQVLAVLSAAIPIFLLVRREDPVAAFLMGVAYVLHPVVGYQTQLAFHVLSLAAPAVAWAAFFFIRGRLWLYLAALAAACCVREDLALLALVAGFPALLSRSHRARGLAWILLPPLVGVMGGTVALLTTRAFCDGGNEVIQGLFSHLGDSPRAIVVNAVTHPLTFLGFMCDRFHLRYLVGLLRPGLFAALYHPLTILVLPVLAINLLARGAGTASLDMYYSVYIPPVLMSGAVMVWTRAASKLARLARASLEQTRIAVAGLMIVATLLSLPCVLNKRQLACYVPRPDVEDIRIVLDAIPPDAAVAAPRHMAHALARREKLYLVNRWADYSNYDPEYVVVETDFSALGLNDGTVESYRTYAEELAHGSEFIPVVVRPRLILYHRVSKGTPGTGADTTNSDTEENP